MCLELGPLPFLVPSSDLQEYPTRSTLDPSGPNADLPPQLEKAPDSLMWGKSKAIVSGEVGPMEGG